MNAIFSPFACSSHVAPTITFIGRAVPLDIDDTVDVVHGHQQLSLFNVHYAERCFLSIPVYDTATSRPRDGAAATLRHAVRRRNGFLYAGT
jgi:hypothetical protein